MPRISDLFEEQAARSPSAVALRLGEQRVTYEELNARANRLARDLQRRGAAPETVVAVSLSYGIDLVVTLLAIVKTGAAYLGLDPAWPARRRAEALDDASAVVAIGDDDAAALCSTSACDVLRLESLAAAIAREPAQNLGVAAAPEASFSIVYTSGSTGRPKGVVVTARSVVNRMEWMWNTYPFRAGDVGLLYRSYASVGFSWDCFGLLLKGVPIVVHPTPDVSRAADLVTASIAERVTHLTASAGLWDLVLDEVERRPGGMPSLRVARTTGERVRPDTVERWRRVFPDVPLLNIYGATECSGSVACDAAATHGPDAPRVAVGTPLPGVQVFIVDDDMRVLGCGQAGEVCIGGASLAHGYVGQPGMTAERFVPSPASGERLFRTGDLGCWRADGLLELVGRRDLQVKVRGFRVEIEDVEAALRACPGVIGAAVRAEHDEDDVRLVALLEASDDALDVRALRDALEHRVPAYMVPTQFVLVDRLPRTRSGKIDRRALSDTCGRVLEPIEPFAAPGTPSEVTIAAIWQRVLRVPRVGVDDDFFELGGHSQAAMRIVTSIQDTFGIDLSLSTFFDAQTVKALALEVDHALQLRDHADTIR